MVISIRPGLFVATVFLSVSSRAQWPGTGVIDSFTINYQKWHPAMQVPFVLARVALDDAPGVILTTNIVGCEVDEVDFGDRVRVTFEQQEDVYLPLFERIES